MCSFEHLLRAMALRNTAQERYITTCTLRWLNRPTPPRPSHPRCVLAELPTHGASHWGRRAQGCRLMSSSQSGFISKVQPMRTCRKFRKLKNATSFRYLFSLSEIFCMNLRIYVIFCSGMLFYWAWCLYRACFTWSLLTVKLHVCFALRSLVVREKRF